jgi:hypothetical protein
MPTSVVSADQMAHANINVHSNAHNTSSLNIPRIYHIVWTYLLIQKTYIYALYRIMFMMTIYPMCTMPVYVTRRHPCYYYLFPI